MRFEQAFPYGTDRPGELGMSRVRLKPDNEAGKITITESHDEKEGERLLFISVPTTLAQDIEAGKVGLEALLEPQGINKYRSLARAYLAQLVANKHYRLAPIPEDAIITESTDQPSLNASSNTSASNQDSSRRSGVLESEYITF
jgi:hypothetical protein